MIPDGDKDWRRMNGARWLERAKNERRCERIFVDPQTSGGLLAALPELQAQEALDRMQNAGLDAARIIGHVRPPSAPDYLVFK